MASVALAARFPARAVTRSEADDIESMFAPAHDKVFRSPSFYHTVAQMHEIKKAQEGNA